MAFVRWLCPASHPNYANNNYPVGRCWQLTPPYASCCVVPNSQRRRNSIYDPKKKRVCEKKKKRKNRFQYGFSCLKADVVEISATVNENLFHLRDILICNRHVTWKSIIC